MDPVEPGAVYEQFWEIYGDLNEGGHLDKYCGVGGTWLISLDGAQYFSSQEIHCSNCRVSVRDEKTYYSHLVMMAVVCAPEQAHVICLDPEFITPQDGHEKQDCEQQAAKRWVERNAERFELWSVTILTDDLHCHQPLCELLLKHKLHFILTCKPDSHEALYEELDLLERVDGAISTKVVRKWNGCYHERWVYRWAEHLPLRGKLKSLMVKWCEVTISNEATGEQLYHNAWATDHTLNEQSVVEVVADGRSRWKVELAAIARLYVSTTRLCPGARLGRRLLISDLVLYLLTAYAGIPPCPKLGAPAPIGCPGHHPQNSTA